MSAVSHAADLRAPEASPSFGDLESDPVRALSRVPMFRGLTAREQEDLARVAQVVRIEQDRIIPRAGGPGDEAAAYYFLVRGQVAFAEFDPGGIPKPPKNKKKRPVPVMQVARRVVSLFDTGEFFTNEHVDKARSEDGEKYDMALFSCVHVVALRLPKDRLDRILEALPSVRAAVEIKAEEAYYRQTLLKLEDRGDILDLYVRQGFEYAHAIKVIQTDKCIDCDECVKACEDRHGIARIERFGPRLGLIQFTLNCRSCQDARCIDVCNFDAIGYDAQCVEPEVIVYDNCVGCTLCAKACPHEAIRMVDLKPEPVDLVGMVQGSRSKRPPTVLATGEEGRKAPKKKKAKRIANKCDHCFGYEDLACISACPTGAIIQIDPRELFRRDGGYIDRADRYFDPAPFTDGYAETTRRQGVWFMRALFVLAAIGVGGCAWEYFARRMDRSLSLKRMWVEWVDGPLAAESLRLSFTGVAGMGRWIGYVAAGMMIVSALYSLRLHVPGLRRIGNTKTWFDFHVVFGVTGPILALLHTDMNVFSPVERPIVTALWWFVTAIVVSGLVGRFLYTAIPKFEASTERERRRLDEGIQKVADQWSAMTMSANVLAQFMKAQEKAQARPTPAGDGEGLLAFLGFLFKSELERFRSEATLRFRTLGDMRDSRLRKATIKLMSRRAVIERRLQFYGLTKKLLALWRSIHIGVTIFMFVLLIAHVAISVYATGW